MAPDLSFSPRRPAAGADAEDGPVQNFEHKIHGVSELHEVNPKLRVAERPLLIVGIPKRCANRVEAIELHNPLSYRRADFLASTLFDETDAVAQAMRFLLDLADDLQVQFQRVPISEQDRVAPFARFSALEG